MEQQIRFCTTSDGVRIAYATAGQGLPLVRALGWFTHLEKEVEWPGWRGALIGGLLARNHLLVRYDGRGVGLSDRRIEDFSLDSRVRDLEAVIDAIALQRCPIVGVSEGCVTAVAYAVRHPERVSHLILYGGWGRRLFPDSERGRERIETSLNLMRHGWGSDIPAYRQFFTSLSCQMPTQTRFGGSASCSAPLLLPRTLQRFSQRCYSLT